MASGDIATQKIDGKSIASDVKKKVATEFDELKSAYPNLQPKLVIVQVRSICPCVFLIVN